MNSGVGDGQGGLACFNSWGRTESDMTEQLNFIKTENFCSAKDNIKRRRRSDTDREEIFVKDISDKGLLSKMCKELFSSVQSLTRV